MKKKVLLFVLSAVLVLSVLSGCGTKETSGNDPSDVIKIGVLEPMTGSSAAGGEMTVEGIKLANEKGKYSFRKESAISYSGQ